MSIDIPADVEAVVYDLDGTLVRLAVDWGTLEERITEILREANVEPSGLDAWDLLDAAEEAGVGEEVESLIATAERDGARESVQLSLADAIEPQRPVGVCSLNCEAACRIALDTHGLTEHIDSVIGRDSVAERKPAPQPLLAVVESLGTVPERTLFVGDSASDEEAAARAGVQFSYVGDGPTNY